MSYPIFQVDAFANKAFKGNPAGVCIFDDEMDESLMKDIAMEMAVSETAFFSKRSKRLRWFTPNKTEIDLCGHATLATTWILHQINYLNQNQCIVFNSNSGPLKAYVNNDEIVMDFPLLSDIESSFHDEMILDFLGLQKSEINFYGKCQTKHIIEINSMERIFEIKPDFNGLLGLPGRGIILTTTSTDANSDFVSRYFAPWVGVNEDPVTGSAHCALAYYWSMKLKKNELIGYQASNRGGIVRMKLLEADRVLISGNAVTVFTGEMSI